MPRLFPSSARPARMRDAQRAGEDYGVGDKPDWRSVAWPAHLHQTEIDRCRINYVDVGSGADTPVVFVHGLSGQWQNWLENIPRFAQERRVIAPDLPGHGASAMPQERISIQGYGRTVVALLEQLELDRVALVGNSMGGFVASEVAIQRPELVERLVLVSAAGITTANLYRSPAALFARVAGVGMAFGAARYRVLARRPRSRHMALALVARHPSKLRADFAVEGLLSGTGKSGFQQALLACLDYDYRDRIPDIACPTLILWGEDDMVLPVKDAHEYERLLRDARKVVLKDTGHIPMAERPVTFNDEVLGFLAASQQPASEAQAA